LKSGGQLNASEFFSIRIWQALPSSIALLPTKYKPSMLLLCKVAG
jgi:hypothetical protein